MVSDYTKEMIEEVTKGLLNGLPYNVLKGGSSDIFFWAYFESEPYFFIITKIGEGGEHEKNKEIVGNIQGESL